MRDCIARIVDASRGFNPEKEAILSEKDAKSLLDELKMAVEKQVKKGADYDDALSAEILSRKLEAKKQGEIQKRNALINITKDQELKTKIDNFIAQGLDAHESFQALLVGTNSNVTGGRASVETKIHDTRAKYIGKLNEDLEREGLLPIVAQKAMQNQIEDELWQLSMKNGKVGVSGSKEAQRIAKIFHDVIEATRIRLNQAGAAIDKVAGFTMTQSHDIAKMYKAGYEKWRNKIIQHLDHDRTFGDADKEKFLKSTYDAITTGIHLKAQGADNGKLFEFKGPSNLAKKVSQARVLHFKSAEDSRAYRMDFGKGDFMEGVLGGIEHSTRNIAMMESFGTNPQAMFERVLQDTKAKYRSDTKVIRKLASSDRMIHNYYKEIDGTTAMVDSPSLASAGSTIRALQSLSKLGGVVISSFSDIPLKVSELHYQGHGLLESYGISFRDIGAHIVNSSERKQLYSSIGVGFDGMLGHIASRFSSTDNLPGRMSKLQRQFFKLNGLTWWTDANKAGTGLAMSHHLANMRDSAFHALDEDTKRIFNQSGITDNDWELIRQSHVKQLDGNHYITPDSIHELPDSMFGKNAIAEKNKLESKLRGYFIDRVNYATLEPGAKERAFYNQGTKRGTVPGELMRLFGQFKQFPTAMVTKVYGRALYGKGRADVPAMVQLAVMSTIFGYASMSAKDLLKGRQPRDPSKATTWGAAFTQGGGAGILGDYLLGNFNRFGNDLTTTLAGPTFSTLNDLASVLSAARNGDDAKAKAVNLIINNAPFANLAYIRPALNYMFIYQLQEHLNPGYLRRMERNVEKQNNQKFIIKPSSVAR